MAAAAVSMDTTTPGAAVEQTTTGRIRPGGTRLVEVEEPTLVASSIERRRGWRR